MGFKLIAIRPLLDYNTKYLKNLRKGQLYKFYNTYNFEFHDNNPDNEIVSVQYLQGVIPEDLYDVSYTDTIGGNTTEHEITVNISAIVGKNGSGKSSLADLFLVSLFFISHRLGFVAGQDFIEEGNKDETQRYKTDVSEIEKLLNVEIYYQLNSQVFKLKIQSGNILLDQGHPSTEAYHFKKEYKRIEKKIDLPPFFYSMIVNYSIYGFNTNQMGIWLKGVFHKNDGYQMPIVINPYKNVGNININIETYLTRSRVLSNLVTITEYRKKINPKSEVNKVELYFDKNKDYTAQFASEDRAIFKDKIIIPLFKKMFLNEVQYPEETLLNIYAECYLIQKIKSIPIKYRIFEVFKDILTLDKTAIDDFITAIFQNRTHITLKIFQTLNFIQDHSYYEIPSNEFKKTNLDFEIITTAIESKRENHWFTQPVEYLPPPFLVTKIVFKDGSFFDDLSSGEMQKIYSLNSIIYHIANLDSVKNHHVLEVTETPNVYEDVNLILDEIELYYHPEYQRTFVYDLLDFIKNAKFKSVKNFNILFLTHSPFILSDIPNSNILFLKVEDHEIDFKGKVRTMKLSTPQDNKSQTFAANLHEIFRSGFFMNSTKGQFAESKITEIIEFCKKVEGCRDENELKELQGSYLEKKQGFKIILSIIGEDYIRQILENNINEVEQKLFSEQEFLKKRAEMLEKELLIIKAKLR